MAIETFELRIEGVLGASYRETVLHFSGNGTAAGDTLASADSLVAGWIANCQPAFLLTLPASYSLVQLTARRATPKPSGQSVTNNGLGNVVGTRGSNATSQQMCPSIFLIPAMGTKSGGKIFWPACPQGDMNQSIPSAGWQTAIGNYFTAATTPFTNAGITWHQVIYSKKVGSTSDIQSHQFSPFVGYMLKRRKPAGAV